MTYYPVQSPYPIFNDEDGTPLENGYIYIGEPNQNPITNPITLSWDINGLYPAAQPVRTIGGYPDHNGTPGRLFMDITLDGNYSIIIQDKHERNVFVNLSALFIDEIRDYITQDSMIFGKWYGIDEANTAAVNGAAFVTAIAAASSLNLPLYLPSGTIEHEGITLLDNTVLIGTGRTNTILLNTNNSDGIIISNVNGCSLKDLTIDQTGNSNSVDALNLTCTSNQNFYNIGIDTPGRYGIALNADGLGTGFASGCFQNHFFGFDIINLSGTKRGIVLTKGDTYRNNSNRFYGGRINNGAYGIYCDTDSGNNNVFSCTVQEQTSACVYDDSASNSYPDIYIETSAGGHGVQIGSNHSGGYFAPRVLTVLGGGSKFDKPAGSPVTNNTFISFPPTGSIEPARLENIDVNAIRSDLGSGDGQYYPVLKPKIQYVNYTTTTNVAETAVTFTLPADSLTGSGDTIKITAWGTTNNAAANKRVDVYFGAAGTRLVASINNSTASIIPWKAEVFVQRTGSATERSFSSSLMGQGTTFVAVDQRTNIPNQDLTADVVISVDLTAAVGATVTMLGWTIEAL